MRLKSAGATWPSWRPESATRRASGLREPATNGVQLVAQPRQRGVVAGQRIGDARRAAAGPRPRRRAAPASCSGRPAASRRSRRPPASSFCRQTISARASTASGELSGPSISSAVSYWPSPVSARAAITRRCRLSAFGSTVVREALIASSASSGLLVHQVDDRQVGGDLGLRHAVEPVVDLVLQQLLGLRQQVDVDQPAGQPAHHGVAVLADRGQFLEVVEQRQRLDRLQAVGLAVEEQARNAAARSACSCTRLGQVRQVLAGRAQRLQRLAVAALAQVELAERADGLQLERAAAPAVAQAVEHLDRLRRRDRARASAGSGWRAAAPGPATSSIGDAAPAPGTRRARRPCRPARSAPCAPGPAGSARRPRGRRCWPARS